MKKRILALAVSVSMVLGLIPQSVLANTESNDSELMASVTYEPTRIRYVPFSRQNFDNNDFVKWAADTGNSGNNSRYGMHSMNSLFTGKISYFKVDDSDWVWKKDEKTNLASKGKITKNGYDHFSFNFKYYLQGNEAQYLKDNNKDGQKTGWLVAFKARNYKKKISWGRQRHSLIELYANQWKTNDKKGASLYYNTQWTKKGGENGSGSKAYKGNYTVNFGFNGGVRDSSETPIPYGQGDWIWLNANTDHLQIKGYTGGGHEPGAEFHPRAIVMMDNLNPYVKKITAKDTNGSEKDKFKAGETIYFDVEFNEFIKTYDDSPNTLADCKLTFTLSGRQGDYHADAVYLKGKIIRFKWTVPQVGTNNEIYDNKITIKNIAQQNWGKSTERSKIVFSKVDNNGNVTWQTHELSKNNHVKEMFNISLITDISGNPLSDAAVNVSGSGNSVYVDNTNPKVDSIALKLGNGNSEPYAGVAANVIATVYFSEDVTTKSGTVNLKNLSLETNVKKSDGTYLVLDYAHTGRVWDYAKQRDFAGVIAEGDVCEGTPYIRVTKILGSDGNNTVTDKYGNELTGKTYGNGVPAPKQQYTVDTSDPIVDFETNADEKLTATFHDGNDNSSFFVKVDLGDEISGLDLDGGALIDVQMELDGKQMQVPVLYQITESPVKPAGTWRSFDDKGHGTFPFLTENETKSHYLHFDFDDDEINGIVENMSINFTISDQVGNSVAETKQVEFIGDFAETVIRKTGYNAGLDNAGVNGEAVMNIEISDGSGIDFVKYQWVPADEQLDETAWTDSEISNVETTATTWKGDISLKDITPGVEHNYNVYIQATDTRGNVTVSEAFPAYVYVGDASFDYTSEGEGEISTAPKLTIHAMTDSLEDANKKITVKVLGGEDKTRPDWTLETILEHTYLEDGSVESFFEEFDVFDSTNYIGGEVLDGTYGKVTVQIACENTSSGAESNLEMEYFFVTAQSGDVHDITLTPLDKEGMEADLTENSNYTTPDDGVLTVSDLSHYTMKIDITDNLIYPGYGRGAIDYSASYITITRDDGVEISRTPLANSDSVVANLPAPDENVTLAHEYTLTVTVTDIAGNVSEKEYAGMVFDNSQIEFDGLVDVVREIYNPITDAAEEISNEGEAVEVLDEIYVSSLGDEEGNSATRLKFMVTYLDRYSDMVFMKAWNETIGETKDNAQWTALHDDMRAELDVRHFESEGANYENTLRVQDGINIVRYMFISANGKETQEKTVIVNASGAKPEIAIDAEGYYELWAQEIRFTLTPQSMVSAAEDLVLYKDGPENIDMTNVYTEGLVTQTEGMYRFGVRDMYNNTNWYEFDVANIDTTPPVIRELNPQTYGAVEFDFSFFASDDKDDCENLHAYVTVDPEFAKDLGLPVEDGETEIVYLDFDKVKLNEQSDYTRTRLSDTLEGMRTPAYSEGELFVSGEGIFPYKYEEGTTQERTFKLYLEDTAGNITSEEFTLTHDNIIPRLEYAGYMEGSAGLGFTAPVMLVNPVEQDYVEYNDLGDEVYREEAWFDSWKNAAWMKPNSRYSIEFVDAWGYQGTADFIVDSDGSFGQIEVKVSTYEPTNKDVTVILDATKNDLVYIKLPARLSGKYTVEAVKNDTYGNVKYAYIKVHNNTSFDYSVEAYNEPDDEHYNSWRRITISNINKKPIEARVVFYADREILENNITWGNVMAVIESLDDRELAAEVGELYHTFVLGSETKHTFSLKDDWGNVAAVEAQLPYTIIAQPAESIIDTDVTPPEYEYEVNINKFGSMVHGGRFAAPPDDENPLPQFADTMTFIFNAYDENAVTYSLENVGDGVTMMGNMITVTKNTAFTMVLTDSCGNVTKVPIDVTSKIDTKPKGEVIYKDDETTGTVKAYINIDFAENEGRDVKVVGSASLGFEDGMYYKEFIENGTYTFYLTDKWGITQGIISAVDKIDSSVPVGKITSATPGIYDEDNKWVALNAESTRQNVAFTVEFTGDDDDEPIYIREITATMLSGSIDDITVENYGEKAVVIYRENAEVKIDFTAANGRKGSLALPMVDFIERNNPVVKITKIETEELGDMAKSITLTFEADRNVFFTNGGAFLHLDKILPEKVFTKKIEQNGDYTFRFVDIAGNETAVKFTVDNINTSTPVLTIEFIGDPTEYVNYDLSAKASMDMPGVIRHLGVDYDVEANEVVDLTLPYSGMYEVLATGKNNLTDSEIITVTKIDKKAPVVLIPGSDLWLKLGDDYNAKLMENVSAYDNAEGDMTDKVNLIVNNGEEITQKGTYAATYSVVDTAGNETVINTSFTVYDDTVTTVFVNGEFVVPGSIAIVEKNDVVITTNLGEEPYKIYYAKGIKTAAQMKYDGKLAAGKLTLSDNSYYTIMVVTQDRQSTLCKIYVEMQ